MSPFKIFCIATRPITCLTAFAGTWAASLLITSFPVFSKETIIPAIVMGLCCLASSLFYTGGVPKKARFAPKFIDVPLPQYKGELMLFAGLTFLAAVIIAARYLPLIALLFIGMCSFAVVIFTLNTGMTRYWFGKSLNGAIICASCVSMAGIHTPPGQELVSLRLPAFIFLFYLLRETLKRIDEAHKNPDLQDMPFKLNDNEPPFYIGMSGAMRIAAVICLVAGVFFVLLIRLETPHSIPFTICGTLLSFGLFFTCAWLFLGWEKLYFKGSHHIVTAGTWMLIGASVIHRLQ